MREVEPIDRSGAHGFKKSRPARRSAGDQDLDRGIDAASLRSDGREGGGGHAIGDDDQVSGATDEVGDGGIDRAGLFAGNATAVEQVGDSGDGDGIEADAKRCGVTRIVFLVVTGVMTGFEPIRADFGSVVRWKLVGWIVVEGTLHADNPSFSSTVRTHRRIGPPRAHLLSA